MPADIQETLRKEYQLRFQGREAERARVWRILVDVFFNSLVGSEKAVLDLGCGYGEFINHVQARSRFAMDLNPEAPRYLREDVAFLHQDCSLPWALDDNRLDVVFTSNFFEHLPNKDALSSTLNQAYRCLKPGGRIICLGPNIRYLGGRYWDFWDHHIPLSDVSLSEALRLHGFSLDAVYPRFLPYTMSEGRVPPGFLIQLYLRLPLFWSLLGKQFLVVGRKSEEKMDAGAGL